MTTMTEMTTVTTSQLYQMFIRATPEAIWDAITRPEFSEQYFHGVRVEHRDGRRYSSMSDGRSWDEAILEEEPPHRLVQEWISGYDPELSAEEASRVTWEIDPRDDGTCLLTVVHDRLEGAPKTALQVAGEGWMFVLSNLKTFLETGKPLS
jgi:uncharacterized protein YndB with AHSA1/START domain